MHTLTIKDLYAEVEGNEILKGLNLTVNTGEMHAIMGPNGTGKSTLAAVIMGHPSFQVTAGEIWIDDVDILSLDVSERAQAGLFLAMQYPSEIAGVTNAEFLRQAINSRRDGDDPIGIMEFIQQLDKNMAKLHMDEEMAERYLNEGFSGGEKKRNEILQMMMLQPTVGILDEIDSGLDIDALQVVADGINALRGDDFAGIMITHYQRLLDYVEPDFVHIMMDGKIVKTGDKHLAKQLEAEGYQGLMEELGYTLSPEQVEGD